MESANLFFTVDFDFLTDLVRSFWAEGSFRKALDLLEELGLPKNVSYDIIRGKLKMIQDPKGKKGIDGTTTKDNWHPDLNLCDRGRYPDPNDIGKIESQRDRYAQRYIDELVAEAYGLLEQLSSEISDGYVLETIEQKLSSFPEEVYDIVGISRNDYFDHLEKARLLYAQRENDKKIVETYIAHQAELDNKPLPKVDTKLESACGWLLPDGKYYPCDWQDHIWLAGKLGRTEKQAEEEGWIKFTLSGIYCNEDKSPTQKQIDIVFRWCKKHDQMKRWNDFDKKYIR